jgi:hypothetical protein
LAKANNGFIYVATLDQAYITGARYSAYSLRDYWPEAQITLYTHEEWVIESDYELFTNIVTEDVPRHKRAKLWACARSPYSLTCYIDADCTIEHEDIQNIFKQHKRANSITITKARAYSASIDPTWDGNELTDHCGMFIFDKKPATRKFMQEWFNLYDKQINFEFNDVPHERFRGFDMYTYWYLQNRTEFAIPRGYFPEPDARWQFVCNYNPEELQGTEPVITHRPIPFEMRTI